MTVSTINKFFEKCGAFQIKHRALYLALIVVFSVIGLAGLPRLIIEDNQDGWFNDSDKIQINQDHFEDLFGNEDAVMVLVQAPDVFAPEVLSAIDRLGKRLLKEVPYADKVTSLMDMSISKGTEEGFEVKNPFEDGIPGGGKPLAHMTVAEKAELAEKKSFILSRDSLVNNIVSDDATETWVVLSLLPFGDDFSEHYVVGNAAIPIVESEEFISNSYTLKAAGMSYTETEENRVITKEAGIRVICGFFVMIFCLAFFVRSLRGVIVPLIASLFGIGSVLGFTAWFGIKADSMLITLPILLGMALSIGYSMHYINSFRLYFRESGKRQQSVINAVRDTGWPILFTVLTTVGSMISFMTIGIGPLKWLGGICALIVFAVYMYVIVLIPILLSYGKDALSASSSNTVVNEKSLQKERVAKEKEERTNKIFELFGVKILNSKVFVIIASIIITIVSIFGIFRISVNMDYIDMMGEKIPYISRLLDILEAKLGSQYSYDVLIEFPEADAFKKPENMKAIDESMKELGNLRLTRISGEKPRVTSVIDIVKEMNRTLNNDDAAFYTVPDDQDMLTQLLFLYEISGGDNLADWLTEDYSTSYIHVELTGYNANQVIKDIKDAQTIVSSHFPNAEVAIIGTVVNYAEMNNKLVIGELQSFMGSLLIIAIMLIIAFASIRTGLIGMVPNIAPVILVGGVMGFCNFSLDMLTMTIMPMVLGIAVDDTIHFVNHSKYYFEKTGNYRKSILLSFNEIAIAMFMSTVILCAMFFVYIFSPMNTLFRVGILSIIGLSSALVADYTLTPVLIYITHPFGKEGEKNEKSKEDN